MPTPIYGHGESVVSVGNGQAFIGGATSNGLPSKVSLLKCSNRYCTFSLLKKDVSVPRSFSVVIPIPDQISGCISSSECYLKVPSN